MRRTSIRVAHAVERELEFLSTGCILERVIEVLKMMTILIESTSTEFGSSSKQNSAHSCVFTHPQPQSL